MRTTLTISHFLTFALLLTAGRANAQAWTQSPGHTYLKLSYGSATAGEQYGFDGQTKLYADDVYEPAFFDRSVYLYGETGLTESLTVAFTLPYKRLIVRDASYRYDTASLGDLELAARYALTPHLGFLPSAGVAAVNLKVGLPLGYDRNLLPAPGAGQVNLTASLDYGHAFGGWGYGQLGVGYRVRTPWFGLSSAVPCTAGIDRGCTADEQPDLGDEAVLRAEVGLRPWGPLLLQGLSEAVLSVQAPSVGFAVGETMPTRQRYLKVGAGVLVEPIAHLGLSAQAFVTPWGRNTVRSVDLFFGLDTDFDLWSDP